MEPCQTQNRLLYLAALLSELLAAAPVFAEQLVHPFLVDGCCLLADNSAANDVQRESGKGSCAGDWRSHRLASLAKLTFAECEIAEHFKPLSESRLCPGWLL